MNRSGYRRSYGSRPNQPESTSKPKVPTPTIFAQYYKLDVVNPPRRKLVLRILAMLFTYALPLLIIAATTGAFDHTGEYSAGLAFQHATRVIAILAALEFHTVLCKSLSDV